MAVNRRDKRFKYRRNYFSHACGLTTVRKKSFSITKAFTNMASGGGSNSESTAQSVDSVQRPLIYPDQFSVMHKQRELLLIENNDPVIAQKIEWYTDPRFASLGVNIGATMPMPQRPLHVVQPTQTQRPEQEQPKEKVA